MIIVKNETWKHVRDDLSSCPKLETELHGILNYLLEAYASTDDDALESSVLELSDHCIKVPSFYSDECITTLLCKLIDCADIKITLYDDFKTVHY